MTTPEVEGLRPKRGVDHSRQDKSRAWVAETGLAGVILVPCGVAKIASGVPSLTRSILFSGPGVVGLCSTLDFPPLTTADTVLLMAALSLLLTERSPVGLAWIRRPARLEGSLP